jgi:PIN domain nuclease of toxin-antitoxin system
LTTLLLDTHVLIWLSEDVPKIGSQSRTAIEGIRTGAPGAFSAISIWEIALLEAKHRLGISVSADVARLRFLAIGLIEMPLTGQIGISAAHLPDTHSDPADRFLVATALAHDATLVTADERILAWPGPLLRLDARR